MSRLQNTPLEPEQKLAFKKINSIVTIKAKGDLNLVFLNF